MEKSGCAAARLLWFQLRLILDDEIQLQSRARNFGQGLRRRQESASLPSSPCSWPAEIAECGLCCQVWTASAH